MCSVCPTASAGVIETSIENSSPSERRQTSVPDVPPLRSRSPPSVKRICSACPAWNRSGTKRSIFCPRASAAEQRSIRSAAALKTTMRRSASMVMMASVTEPMMPVRRASLARSTSAEARRSISGKASAMH